MLWPFQNDITIQLLNQLEDTNHHAYCFHFSKATDPEVVNRVTSGERAKNAWGTSTFIRHTDLGLNTDGNTLYLKDDALKFRVLNGTPDAVMLASMQPVEQRHGIILQATIT